MLELARVHALERVQFGRPIAAFQACGTGWPRPRGIEAAAALLDAAWTKPLPATAGMAKAFAAGRPQRSAPLPTGTGGIGFTTETRCTSLPEDDRVWISCSCRNALTRQLGTDMLRSGTLRPPSPSDRAQGGRRTARL